MRGKGEGSVFKDSRGLWNAWIELPPVNGNRRRKVIRSKNKATLLAKMRELQQELEKTGDLPTADITLEQWMDRWFTDIALKTIRPKTASTYRSLIRREIVPTLGTRKLRKLTAADVRLLGKSITAKGLSSTTALQAHRILAVALKAAEREGLVPRNVATLTDAPRRAAPKLRAFSVDEAIQVLRTAETDPLGSLWASVLLTGAREGELLGLEIERLTDRALFDWQLQRIIWSHGCGGECGWKRGSDCPKRFVDVPADFEYRHITGGLWWTRPKSRAGWRSIPIVEPLRTILDRRLAVAATAPNPHGLVWTMPNGSPIDPRVCSELWHDLLARAGVPDIRLHDGRHTTVDLLLLAEVPEDIIMEIVGHSSRMQTRAYKSRGNQARLASAMHALAAVVTPRDDSRSGTPGAAA